MTHGIQIGIDAASAVELVTGRRASCEVYRLRVVFPESQSVYQEHVYITKSITRPTIMKYNRVYMALCNNAFY